MKWTKDQSIRLSMIFIWIFAGILLILDVFAFRLVSAYIQWREMNPKVEIWMMLSLYSSSIFGWICLYALRKLLTHISHNEIFIEDNVKMLRIISWCCGIAAILFFASGFYYGPFFILATAAAFMMLIVRIVKNVFSKANEMKNELDLTI